MSVGVTLNEQSIIGVEYQGPGSSGRHDHLRLSVAEAVAIDARLEEDCHFPKAEVVRGSVQGNQNGGSE
jgi:hypothetical protein